MSEDIFLKNRILWRASKHNLFSKACLEFSAVDRDRQAYLLNKANLLGDPILLFWSSENLWTLLTTKEVVSQINTSVTSVSLDGIKKNVKLEKIENVSEQVNKLKSSYLIVGESGARIWAPNGAEIFALMNILRMFPLKEK